MAAASSLARKDPGAIADAAAISLLQMHRHRIMDERADAARGQTLAQRLAREMAHDILVEDVLGAVPARRKRERCAGETCVVEPRQFLARAVLVVERRQLRAEHRGLERIEPRVHAGHGAQVALAPAIFAQLPHARGERRIVRRDRAAVAERAQVLGRIEAEGGNIGDRAEPPAMKPRAVRLGAVLDNTCAVPAGESEDRVEIGRLPIKVHRDDGGDAPGR